MKLEQQVCSLELAIKLKKLGVTAPSIFFFEWTGAKPNEIEQNTEPCYNLDNVNAYTVAELGEIMKGKGMGTSAYASIGETWWVAGGEWDVGKQKYTHTEQADNEADARAKTLIYLLEHNLIKNNEI